MANMLQETAYILELILQSPVCSHPVSLSHCILLWLKQMVSVGLLFILKQLLEPFFLSFFIFLKVLLRFTWPITAVADPDSDSLLDLLPAFSFLSPFFLLTYFSFSYNSLYTSFSSLSSSSCSSSSYSSYSSCSFNVLFSCAFLYSHYSQLQFDYPRTPLTPLTPLTPVTPLTPLTPLNLLLLHLHLQESYFWLIWQESLITLGTSREHIVPDNPLDFSLFIPKVSITLSCVVK